MYSPLGGFSFIYSVHFYLFETEGSNFTYFVDVAIHLRAPLLHFRGSERKTSEAFTGGKCTEVTIENLGHSNDVRHGSGSGA